MDLSHFVRAPLRLIKDTQQQRTCDHAKNMYWQPCRDTSTWHCSCSSRSAHTMSSLVSDIWSSWVCVPSALISAPHIKTAAPTYIIYFFLAFPLLVTADALWKDGRTIAVSENPHSRWDWTRVWGCDRLACEVADLLLKLFTAKESLREWWLTGCFGT